MKGRQVVGALGRWAIRGTAFCRCEQLAGAATSAGADAAAPSHEFGTEPIPADAGSVRRPDDPTTRRPFVWVLFLALGGYLTLLSLQQIHVVDLWWQMKAGQIIWERLRLGTSLWPPAGLWPSDWVPQVDPFSYTAAGAPWIVHEWLPDLLFFLVYTGGGKTGVPPLGGEWLVAVKAVLVPLTFTVVLARCLQRTNRPVLSTLLAAFAATTARGFFDIRPQLATYLLAGVALLLVESWRARGGRWRLLMLPAVFFLWANLHAGVVFGLALLGAVLTGEIVDALLATIRSRRVGVWEYGSMGKTVPRPTHQSTESPPDPTTQRPDAPTPPNWAAVSALLAVLVLCAIAGLLNPNGWRLYTYPFLILGHANVQDFIVEWFSPNFHEPQWRWTEAYLGLVVLALAASRRRPPAYEIILLLALGHMALFSVRHIPLLVIVCTPFLASHLAAALERVESHWPVARHPALALLGVTFSVTLLSAGIVVELRRLPPGADLFTYAGNLGSFPAAATDAIERQRLQGRLFNDYKWGGWCIWRFWPHRRVFIDGRAEVYFHGPPGASPYDDYYNIHNVRSDWEDLLAKWEVDIALVDANSYLQRVMSLSPQWRRSHADGIAQVFVRREPFWRKPDSAWRRDQAILRAAPPATAGKGRTGGETNSRGVR
jgi:hypothetical protein